MRHTALALLTFISLATTFGCASAPTGPYVPELVEPREILPTDVVEPPVGLHRPMPAGSEALHADGVRGQIALRGIVREDGSVTDLKVLGSDHQRLVPWALQTLSGWRFQPATINGEPVAVYYNWILNLRTGM